MGIGFIYCSPPQFWHFLGPRGTKARRGGTKLLGGGTKRGGTRIFKGGELFWFLGSLVLEKIILMN